MPSVARLTVYPVKGLSAVDVSAAQVTPGGTLAHDREFALRRPDGERVNAKQSDRFHTVDLEWDPATETLTLAQQGAGAESFAVDSEAGRAAAADWLSAALGLDGDVSLDRDTTTGHVDRRTMGPSVISTATLEEVASWFDDLTVHGVRRRLRANVEVEGVPAFWEDRFVGRDAPSFRAGDVRFDGETPCGRCVVPERDPETGEPHPEFRQRFIERREATFPDFADREAFDHLYTVMLIASIPERDRGQTVSVGDEVAVID